MQRCAFRLLSLKDPWRSFAAQPPSLTCHSVLWQLVGRPPNPSPLFHSFTLPVFLLYPSMLIGGSHFHVSGGPRQCDSSLSACLIRNSQFGLGSSRRGDWRSVLPNPGTVRSALLTPVNQIIIWLDLTSTHTLIHTPRLQLIHVRTHKICNPYLPFSRFSAFSFQIVHRSDECLFEIQQNYKTESMNSMAKRRLSLCKYHFYHHLSHSNSATFP